MLPPAGKTHLCVYGVQDEGVPWQHVCSLVDVVDGHFGGELEGPAHWIVALLTKQSQEMKLLLGPCVT